MQQSYMKDGNAKTRLASPRVTILRSQIRVIGDEDSCARRDVTHTQWSRFRVHRLRPNFSSQPSTYRPVIAIAWQ
jgi:hypothetical protein